MPRIHGSLIGAALVVTSAATLSAQTVPARDSARVTTLTTVTITAESPNWFSQADDLRKGVIMLDADTRRLANELRRHDAHVALLATRLDSLKTVEAEQMAAIATIDEAVAKTRARRQALEARILAAEIRRPDLQR